ncbi:MAG: hypothetical protein IT160_11595 [Bryobacterales bacterium]|nr:hypothetical protein [Bryobacterales bacterium]
MLVPTPTLTSSDRSSSLFGLLVQFSYLQVLDFLTTLAFLLHGVQEANPLVRWCLSFAPNPLVGLAAVKLMGIGLGIYCWRMRKSGLLVRMNVLFALLIAWNLLALIIASAYH